MFTYTSTKNIGQSLHVDRRWRLVIFKSLAFFCMSASQFKVFAYRLNDPFKALEISKTNLACSNILIFLKGKEKS